MKKCFLSCFTAVFLFTIGFLDAGELIYRASFNKSLVPEVAPDGTVPLTYSLTKAKIGMGMILSKGQSISIPVDRKISNEQGSIMVWLGGKNFSKYIENEIRIIELGSGKTKILVWKPAGSERLYFSYSTNGYQGIQWFPIYDWKEGEFHCVFISWSRENCFLMVDGELSVSATNVNDMPKSTVNVTNLLNIGKSTGEYIIDEIFWFDHPMNEQESASLWKTIYLGQLAYQAPFAVVNATAKTPTIDGVILNDEWQDATVISGFIQMGTGLLIKMPVNVYMTYDKKFFYFGFESPIINDVNCTKVERDSKDIFSKGKNQIELFLVPYYTWSLDYFQAAFDPAGSIYDGLCINPKAWNGRWITGSRADKGKWTFEAKIDYGSFPQKIIPRSGDNWKINICRTGLNKDIPLTQWSNTGNGYHNMNGFGSIRFEENKLAVKTREFMINDNRNIRINGSLSNLSPKIMDKVLVNIAVFPKVSAVPGVPEWSENISIEPIDPGSSRDFTFNRDTGHIKSGTIVLKIYDRGETYYSQMVNF